MREGPMKCRLKMLIKMCEGFIYFVYLFIWICLIYIEIFVAIKNAERYHPIDEKCIRSSRWKTISDRFHLGSLEFRYPIHFLRNGGDFMKRQRKENNKDFFNGEPLNTISCFVCCLAFCSRHSYPQTHKKNFLMEDGEKNWSMCESVGRISQCLR